MTGATIIATYSGGGTLWDPGVEVQDGDAVLWFYREASAESGPSGRMCDLTDSGGTSIGATLYTKGNWGIYSTEDYYITYIYGNFELDSGGTKIVEDTIYVVFDQFHTFTAGNHYIKFNLPGVSRARVEAAHLLRGVAPETPGTYHYFLAESPNWEKAYSDGGSVIYNAFPVTVPLGTGSTIVYCLWSMNGDTVPPAGYNSVPGTLIKSYTSYDPDVPPVQTDKMISYFDGCTGAGKSVTAPDEDGASGRYPGTRYTMDAVVINGGETVVPAGPTVYFADMIVFNAKTGVTVEF